MRGDIAAPSDLSTDGGGDGLLRSDVRARLRPGAPDRPYVSPDTKEWVVANATLIPQADGRKRAFVHFEVTVESFRRAMGETTDASELRIIDARPARS